MGAEASIVGFSLDSSLSEREFLWRELRIEIQCLETDELRKAIAERHDIGLMSLIVVVNADKISSLLDYTPKDSLVLLILGDEAYNPHQARVVLNHQSVRCIFRNYPTEAASIVNVLRFFLQTIQVSDLTRMQFAVILADLFRGIRSRLRMRSWRRAPKPVFVVPLGYTNKFANSLCQVLPGIPSEASLFGLQLPEKKKEISFTFRGLPGQLQRQIAIDKIRAFDDVDIVISSSVWNGHEEADLDGRSYVEALLKATNALCPPGFINGETFRYYEALICGALPVEEPIVFSHQGILPARPREPKCSLTERTQIVKQELHRISAQLRESLRNPN
jgi:hypothetical protein